MGRGAPDLLGGGTRSGGYEGVFVTNDAQVAERFLREKIFSIEVWTSGLPRNTGSQTERNEELCVGWPRAANQGYQSRRGALPSKTRSLRGWVMTAKRP